MIGEVVKMMRERRAAIGVALLLVMIGAGPAGAEETKSGFSVGIRSQIDKWTVSVKQYAHMRGDGYFDPDKVVSKESDVGFLVGPELAFSRGSWFIRGFYLQGESDLSDTQSAAGKTEKGERKITGIDIGVGGWAGAFLGYRDIKVSFPDRQTSNLTDQSISDAVLGVFVGTLQGQPGFGVRFEMLGNVSSLVKAFDDDAFKEEKFIGDAEFNVSYKFRAVPLSIAAGYGISAFDRPVREFTPGSTLIFDRVLERQENWSHGGTVKVSYGF